MRKRRFVSSWIFMVLTIMGVVQLHGQALSQTTTDDSEVAAPLRIGEIQEARLSIQSGLGKSRRMLQYPGAAFIKVHFSDLSLRPGDTVSVADPAGREVHTYPGSDFTTDGGQGFWALSITGDTAIVTLNARGKAVEPSLVVIDKLTRGYPPAEIAKRVTSICGANDEKDVACYSSSHPTELARSRSVARLLLNNGSSLCTAWRVGPDSADYMVTNEHCITTQADVQAAEAWFDYQRLTCGGAVGVPVKVSGRTLLADNPTLDFALFTVNSFWKIGSFGYLELDVRTPVQNEEIYIPQHPGGKPKQLSIQSDVNAGSLCRIDTPVTNGNGVGTDTAYRCDTEPGSSGSPVLARSSHRVIALHHFGVCPNRGVRIDKLWPAIKGFFDWRFFWGNGGSSQIALWNMKSTDRYFKGDFNGDGRDELLAISVNGWAHVMELSNGSWQWKWGNGGSNQIALWNMKNTDRYVVGDFDKDGQDDLLAVSVNGWAHVMKYVNGAWQWKWGNGGSNQIALWNMKSTDQYIAGDFDKDGQDELLAISVNGWAHVMKYVNGGWQWKWGNNGSGKIALWNMKSSDRYLAGDFDGDGRDELLAISTNGWVHTMAYDGSLWQWRWGNGGTGKIALWNMNTSDQYTVGDFDHDGRDELLSVALNGWSHLMNFEGGQWQWGWGNGGSGHIALWYMNPGDRYLPGDYDKDGQDELLTISTGGWAHLTEYSP